MIGKHLGSGGSLRAALCFLGLLCLIAAPRAAIGHQHSIEKFYPDIDLENQYDSFYGIARVSDRTIALVGGRSIAPEQSNGWITIVDTEGEVQVERSLSASGAYSSTLFDVAVLPGGDLVAAGWSNNPGQNDDGWVVRFNEKGNIVWNKTFGAADRDRFYFIDVLPNGDIISGGRTENNPTKRGKTDGIVLVLDAATGRQKSHSRYGEGVFRSAFLDGKALPDGGMLLAGWASDPNSGKDDIWLVKVDSNGAIVFDVMSNFAGDDLAYSIVPAPDGGVTAFGSAKSGDEARKGLVAHFGASGESLWRQSYEWGNGGNDAFYFGTRFSSGAFLVGGAAKFGAANQKGWWLVLDPLGGKLGEMVFDTNRSGRLRDALVGPGMRAFAAGWGTLRPNQNADGWLTVATLGTGSQAATTEPGDAASDPPPAADGESPLALKETAQDIGVFSPNARKRFQGSLTALDQAASYSFTAQAPLSFRATAESTAGDVDLELLDASGNIIQVSNNSGAAAEFIEQRLDPGRYSLRVLPYVARSDFDVTILGSEPQGSRAASAGIGSDGLDLDERQRIEIGLSLIGYDPGLVDGHFTSKTRQAIRALQASIGDLPDGQLTSRQRLRLALEAAATAVAEAKSAASAAAKAAQGNRAIGIDLGQGETFRGDRSGKTRYGIGKFDSRSYQGEWRGRGRMLQEHGFGVTREDDGEIGLGQYVDGKLKGYATLKFADQSYYIGEWGPYIKEGSKQVGAIGYGTYVKADGESWSGLWHNNGLKKEIAP